MTKELIEKARQVCTNDVVAHPRRYMGMIHELVDALEAQTGVKVDMHSAVGVESQLAARQPLVANSEHDREALVKLVDAEMWAVHNQRLSFADAYEIGTRAVEDFSERLTERLLGEGFSRAAAPDAAKCKSCDRSAAFCGHCTAEVVPDAPTDARKHLHAMCNCVPNLGPAHCHLCSKEAGPPVAWTECVAVTQTVADAALVVETERVRRIGEQVDRVAAERDAALAAVERVRAVAESRRYGMPEHTTSSYQEGQKYQQKKIVDQLLAALDGAPEPAWEYGRKYVDEAGDPCIRVSKDVTSPDGQRADGTPYWNYQSVRRRPTGPWLPVEGESNV